MQGDAGWDLALRVVLAMVFATAAAAKLNDREGTRTAFARFGLSWLAAPGAWALPAVELAVAAALLPSMTARWAAAGAAVLLAGFSVALWRSRDADCGCFGALDAHVSVAPLARNAVLGLAAVGVAAGWRPLEIAAVAAVAVGVAVVLARALRRAPDAGEEPPAAALPRTPDAGTRAPTFAVPALGGGYVTLPDLLLAGRPVVLVFSSPDCRPCDALAGRVARWHAERGDELTFAVVSRNGAEAINGVAVLLQVEYEVARAYGAGHMPSGLLIDPDGRVASPLAVGDLDLERLVAAEPLVAV